MSKQVKSNWGHLRAIKKRGLAQTRIRKTHKWQQRRKDLQRKIPKEFKNYFTIEEQIENNTKANKNNEVTKRKRYGKNTIEK